VRLSLAARGPVGEEDGQNLDVLVRQSLGGICHQVAECRAAPLAVTKQPQLRFEIIARLAGDHRVKGVAVGTFMTAKASRHACRWLAAGSDCSARLG
jgi:hypothetical protein